jgi:hypothetical protein
LTNEKINSAVFFLRFIVRRMRHGNRSEIDFPENTYGQVRNEVSRQGDIQ